MNSTCTTNLLPLEHNVTELLSSFEKVKPADSGVILQQVLHLKVVTEYNSVSAGLK